MSVGLEQRRHVSDWIGPISAQTKRHRAGTAPEVQVIQLHPNEVRPRGRFEIVVPIGQIADGAPQGSAPSDLPAFAALERLRHVPHDAHEVCYCLPSAFGLRQPLLIPGGARETVL